MAEKQYKLVTCTINGRKRSEMVDVRASLSDMLRNDYRLTSVKIGCEVGECGACTVLINGEAFNSCIYLAIWADGKEITTLEGLSGPNGELSDIQQAFIDNTAAHCARCCPVIYAAAPAMRIFSKQSKRRCTAAWAWNIKKMTDRSAISRC